MKLRPVAEGILGKTGTVTYNTPGYKIQDKTLLRELRVWESQI